MPLPRFSRSTTVPVMAVLLFSACGGKTPTRNLQPNPPPTTTLPDQTAPVITLNGDNPLTLTITVPYVEPGATALDETDGIVDVVVDGVVDVSIAASYTVRYTATDKAGNIAQVSRVVVVEVKDEIPPEVVLMGQALITIMEGTPYVEQGATASDDCDGDIDVVVSGSVNSNEPDIYVLSYTATDAGGNSSTVTRTVIVDALPDTTAPVIVLNGPALMDVVELEPYVELGATVTDNRDAQVDVVVTGTVQTGTLGTYTITYTATDTALNTASITRSVVVKPMRAFVTLWKTDNPGFTNNNQIKISSFGEGYRVDWGDGSTDEDVKGDIVHTYASPGEYTVSIRGTFQRMRFGGQFGSGEYDSEKLIAITQWGDIKWDSMEYAFANCSNLEGLANDVPDLSRVSSIERMFVNASTFNQDIGDWDVSMVTDMRGMFFSASAFNQYIGDWDVSAATNLSYMFALATAFDQDISAWDVSVTTDLSYMFAQAAVFDQDITGWDVSAVTNMSGMFLGSGAFNQNIGGWQVGAVTNMSGMFERATVFDQNVGGWNVSEVTNMNDMFNNTQNFDQNIGGWNVGAVTDMSGMFRRAEKFNSNIENWDVSAVTDMSYMFEGTPLFDQNIGSWKVGAVKDMRSMFSNARAFNQDIGGWNVGAVTRMDSMFSYAKTFNQYIGGWNVGAVTRMDSMFLNAKLFNQDIGGWNVGAVTQMSRMFSYAEAFDQNLGGWDVSAVSDMYYMLLIANLSTENYDLLLKGWSTLSLQANVNFAVGYTKYSSDAQAARDILTSTFNWSIIDGGVAP